MSEATPDEAKEVTPIMARKQTHGMSAEVIERDERGRGTAWLVTCGCKTRWTGPTYEVVEDKWRQHLHAETGTPAGPMGDKTDRWSA